MRHSAVGSVFSASCGAETCICCLKTGEKYSSSQLAVSLAFCHPTVSMSYKCICFLSTFSIFQVSSLCMTPLFNVVPSFPLQTVFVLESPVLSLEHSIFSCPLLIPYPSPSRDPHIHCSSVTVLFCGRMISMHTKPRTSFSIRRSTRLLDFGQELLRMKKPF